MMVTAATCSRIVAQCPQASICFTMARAPSEPSTVVASVSVRMSAVTSHSRCSVVSGMAPYCRLDPFDARPLNGESTIGSQVAAVIAVAGPRGLGSSDLLEVAPEPAERCLWHRTTPCRSGAPEVGQRIRCWLPPYSRCPPSASVGPRRVGVGPVVGLEQAGGCWAHPDGPLRRWLSCQHGWTDTPLPGDSGSSGAGLTAVRFR
jgi:hypothetical protein